MANKSMIPVLAVVVRPFNTKSPIVPFFATPATIAIIANNSGIITKEVNGESFLVMMTYMKTMIMA